jgi:hypothetical protein
MLVYQRVQPMNFEISNGFPSSIAFGGALAKESRTFSKRSWDRPPEIMEIYSDQGKRTNRSLSSEVPME